MQINIYAFTKNFDFEEALAEYRKRITIKLNLIKLKADQNKSAEMCKNNEEKLFLAKYNKTSYLVILDAKGINYDSENFANWFQESIYLNKQIDILIGGSFGIADSLKAKADKLISLSKMTFPHKFIPLLLLEQIYRAEMISKNHSYHK